MSLIVLVALIAAGIGGARYWGTPRPSGPVSELPEMIDLGTFRERTELTGVIPVRNAGSKPLWVEEISAGCSCLRAEKPVGEIAPGESADIKLKYTFSGGPGQTVDRMVQIRTNEGREWKAVLVRAALVDYVAPSPWRMNAQLDVGDSLRKEVRLTCTNAAEKFRIKSMTSDVPGFKIRSLSEGDESDVEFLLEVRRDEFTEAGTVEGTIRVETTSINSPEVKIPVSITVVPRVNANPPLVVFQESDGKLAPATVEIKSRIPVLVSCRDSALTVRDVSIGDTGEKSDEPREISLFELSPPKDESIAQSGTIQFDIDGDPSTKSVEVRYLVVRPE
jgi:hypothetical protein